MGRGFRACAASSHGGTRRASRDLTIRWSSGTIPARVSDKTDRGGNVKRSPRLIRLGASGRVLALGLLVFSAAAVHAQTPQAGYNLISIVTDDQASWSIGAYGNRDARTPNMDRLAREGAAFTNAFTVTPVCSPSRASLLTGRYGTQLGITDWITPQEARDGLGLPVTATTWPEILQRHG